MIYRQWTEVPEHIINEMTEERIVRDLIHNLIKKIPLDELEEIFKVTKRKNHFTDFNPYLNVTYLVTLESDITREEIEIKAELIRQLKDNNFM